MGVRVTQMCTTGGNNAAAVVLEPTVQIDSFFFVVVGLSDVWGRGRRCGSGTTATSGPPPPPPVLAGSTWPTETATPQPRPVSARELEITYRLPGRGRWLDILVTRRCDR